MTQDQQTKYYLFAFFQQYAITSSDLLLLQ